MREPAFTPGPWSLVINKFGENVLVQPATDRTLFLLDDGETTDWNQDEANANARLIAAAPRMYAAAEALLDRCDQHAREVCEPVFIMEREELRAALSLALGESPNA